jgi:hypothetical protein
MKALTIRQPWVWAIFHAGKDIENRDWPTRLRGRIAIHAAKGMTRDEYESALFFIQEATGKFQCPDFEELVRGAIIGTVEIAGCVSKSGSPWFMGDYGFLLRDAIALPEPIGCRGALGFWDVPDDILRQL